ncbi:MAG TPA: FHA domain-containing protein [Polyangia bacterium]|nr:FHA domain-containing protein [Polyangia bacterium]
MHKLIIEDDEGKAVVVPLIRDEISIGRQEGNTIRLTERNVSRRHARLVKREGRYVIEDLGSHTGTKINGSAIKAAVPLNDGDHIVIGDYKLAIKIERPTTTTLGYPNMPLPSAGAPTPATPLATPAAAPATAPSPSSAVSASMAAVAPAEPMEGAPTIPVRTLADQGLAPSVAPLEAPAPASTAPARLVVTTPPLAGQEFLLDRASVVIGRTQENDIVLNHKSISRHHAKVIRDGDRYVVVDLESANGVRVNGAEYERVELQSGDMLELGHVRLRFATADDVGNYESDFRFGGNRKPVYIGVGAAAVLVVGGLLLFGGSKKETVKLPPPPAAKVAVTPLPPTTPPASPSTAPATPGALPPPAGAESVPTILAEAKKAYDQQKWGDAIVLVDKAVKASPTDTEDADELRKAIEAEQQNAAKYDALQHAADIRDYEAVLRGSLEISEGSFYKAKAKALEEEARGKLIARHLDTAEKKSADGNCTDARKAANAVLAIDAENQAAKDLIARCGKAAKAPAAVIAKATPSEAPPTPKPAAPKPLAVATPPAPKPVAAVTPPPTAPAPKPAAPAPARPAAPKPTASARPASARAPSEGPAPSSADGDALMQEAQDAWLKGQYSAAIDASRKALRAKPGLTRAYQIIAVCSCSLRDAESATKAYERLDDRNKQLVKQLCAKSGITIE